MVMMGEVGYYSGMSVCVLERSGVASTGTSTGVLTVALAPASIPNRRRSRVGRGVEWLLTFADFCTFPCFFGTRFSLFSRLAGSVATDLFIPPRSTTEKETGTTAAEEVVVTGGTHFLFTKRDAHAGTCRSEASSGQPMAATDGEAAGSAGAQV